MNDTTVIGSAGQVEDVRAYVRAVRAWLGDLPADEVEDLTAGMEADLAERAAESGGPLGGLLGQPEAYAAELRSAAGLPARVDVVVPDAVRQDAWCATHTSWWRGIRGCASCGPPGGWRAVRCSAGSSRRSSAPGEWCCSRWPVRCCRCGSGSPCAVANRWRPRRGWPWPRRTCSLRSCSCRWSRPTPRGRPPSPTRSRCRRATRR